MKIEELSQVFRILRNATKEFEQPLAEKESIHKDPFRIAIGVLMSARTRDETTEPAVQRLFKEAPTADEMVCLTSERIEKLIFPVGFYRTKAKHIRSLSRMLVEKFEGRVPKTMDELLLLPGIGRKSANLILGVAFGIPSICVDTHVHRIVNRWGYITTKTPAETETALRETLPRIYWIEINRLLVVYGQNVCAPISPYCSKCKIERFCDKVGVTTVR